MGHGDLHARNVLVGVRRGEAEYPVVFDYGEMGRHNVLAWDFAKLEAELTRKLLPRVVADPAAFEWLAADSRLRPKPPPGGRRAGRPGPGRDGRQPRARTRATASRWPSPTGCGRPPGSTPTGSPGSARRSTTRPGDDRYWLFATEGEAALIRGRPRVAGVPDAAGYYRDALAELSPGQGGMANSSYKQLCRLRRALGDDRVGPLLELFERSPFRPSLTLGYLGREPAPAPTPGGAS